MIEILFCYFDCDYICHFDVILMNFMVVSVVLCLSMQCNLVFQNIVFQTFPNSQLNNLRAWYQLDTFLIGEHKTKVTYVDHCFDV